MRKIAFVACSKTKAGHRSPAAALYTSPLFRKSLLAALDRNDDVYILSAKHGVIALGDPIDPYNVTLKMMKSAAKIAWGEMVQAQLSKIVSGRDLISLYCGEEYIAPLRKSFRELGCAFTEPMTGLSIGPRLAYLRTTNDEETLQGMFRRLRIALRRLAEHQSSGRRFVDCDGRIKWPERGVYLIAEGSGTGSKRLSRIVRIGTHAVSQGSRTTLWNRLSTHRGTSDGRGSHRSSIFRSHVGRALMNREPSDAWPESWAIGQNATAVVRTREVTLERQVSAYIGALKLLWLNIPDAAGPNSDRAYVERNLIGLLSRINLLSPIKVGEWLGAYSVDWRIPASGLWNLDHIFTPPDPEFLDVLESYIAVTLGEAPEPPNSLAPPEWRRRPQFNQVSDQLNLFDNEIRG